MSSARMTLIPPTVPPAQPPTIMAAATINKIEMSSQAPILDVCHPVVVKAVTNWKIPILNGSGVTSEYHNNNDNMKPPTIAAIISERDCMSNHISEIFLRNMTR